MSDDKVVVAPAEAGAQFAAENLDPGLRRDDFKFGLRRDDHHLAIRVTQLRNAQ